MTTAVKLPKVNKSGFYEIRMESIGGFGANLAGKILGEAGILGMGLNGSNFASYGSEKKGSPVKSFVRFCAPEMNVRVNSPVIEPHLLVIFVENMAKNPAIFTGVTKDTTIIICTEKTPDEARDYMKLPAGTVVTVNAMKIAVEEKTRINTALLGTIAKASGFIDSEAIKEAIKVNLGKKYAFLIEPNLKTFDRGFSECQSKTFEDDGKYKPSGLRRDYQQIGYFNQPMGGVITSAGNSINKDLSGSRAGFVPVLYIQKCTSCGECDITCPDYCFVWKDATDKKGRPTRELVKINYQHCKGCLRCIEICGFDALKSEMESGVDKGIIEKGYTDALPAGEKAAKK